ncbi:hypothetical protein HAX54_000408 [Datura stramonium]|uniref:Uncharacterized protein n=1 Tax=Datura stramonium TaxID=4076 RepID=A0ABS8T202_DATST|nr:hypothetical protein [Datura stramonium]
MWMVKPVGKPKEKNVIIPQSPSYILRRVKPPITSSISDAGKMTGKSSVDIHHHTRLVLKYAVASRLVLIFLIVLWRSLLSPYDTSASINPSCLSNTSSIYNLLSGSNSNLKSDSPRFSSAIGVGD